MSLNLDLERVRPERTSTVSQRWYLNWLMHKIMDVGLATTERASSLITAMNSVRSYLGVEFKSRNLDQMKEDVEFIRSKWGLDD